MKENAMQKKITKIVLTGGPCSGKTSGMSYLSQKLGDLGYCVIVVGEYPTEIMGSGITPLANISLHDFQHNLLLGQRERDARYISFAKAVPREKIVILFDRGLLDIKAYMSEASWNATLDDTSLQEVILRDELYDAVIHMRSVAYDKPEYYTRENNPARIETVEEAKIADEKVLNAWIGHSHVRVIDNKTNFEDKLGRVLREILHILGEPIPLEIERKYLVADTFDWRSIPVPFQEIDIEQAYLVNDTRIRKRGQNGSHIYTETRKQSTPGTIARIEIEQRIRAREYCEKMEHLIPGSSIIRKKRICFIYEGQYFEFDFFEDGITHPLLEIELTDVRDTIMLPPWIPIIRDVTEEKEYTNRSIALTKR